MRENASKVSADTSRGLRAFWSRPVLIWLAPAFLMALLLAFSAWFFTARADSNREAQQQSLVLWSEQMRDVIDARFDLHQQRILAGQALFDLGHVSREDWRAYARRISPSDPVAGLMATAWIVPATGIDQAEALRAGFVEDGFDRSLSFPAFQPGQQGCLIAYTEPVEQAGHTIGLNVCNSPELNRLAAVARETDQVSLSRLLVLAPDPEAPLMGFAIMGWVDAGHGQAGWVSGSMTRRALFGAGEQPSGVTMQVYSQTAEGESREIYRLGQVHRPEPERVRAMSDITLGGQPFQLTFESDVPDDPLQRLILIPTLSLILFLGLALHVGLRSQMRVSAAAASAARAFEESESLLRSITANISEGIYRGVPGVGLVYVNQALVDMFGFASAEEMLAYSGDSFYASPDVRKKLLDLLETQGGYRNEEVEFVRPDGKRFHGVNSAVATRDEQGKVSYFDGVIYDITERIEVEKELHRLARFDTLTGLPNRSLLNDRIRQAVAQSGRTGQAIAILFMDLDRFKSVNDSLGHRVGDQLLVAVADRLRGHFREYDTISRLGGDEFVMMMPGADGAAAAHKAESLIAAFDAPFVIDGLSLRVTPSIGIAMYPEDGDSGEDLLRHADNAMYHAKERGRATFEFFTRALHQRVFERLNLENLLRHAIARGELSLVYQPLLAASTGAVVSTEALLRWNSPELGHVPPDRFITVAEQSGLILEIGAWVLDQALAQLARWRAEGMTELSVSVNVSAVQVSRGRLPELVASSLERHGVPGDRLHLELTENVIMSDLDLTRKTLAALKALGVRLAIDDFGTGYSSLSYVKQLRIDYLKIDKSFVRDLTSDNDDAAIVSAVIGMAHQLRIAVVAEGVETQNQLDFLKRSSCDLLQGYFFSRPIDSEQMTVFYRERSEA